MTARSMAAVLLLAATVTLSPLASAGALDSLKKGAGDIMNSGASGQQSGGAASLLSQLSTGSFNLGSIQNVAGVLGYCEKQGYAQSATDRVKSSLMQKLGGPSQAENSDSYQQGTNGVLQNQQGNSFSLTGLKDKVGQRICSAVTQQAMSSFLGQ